MQSAVCPEVRLGLDSAVSAIASVTEVELSKDMQVSVRGSTRCCRGYSLWTQSLVLLSWDTTRDEHVGTAQVAKIYISVYSDPHGKTVAMRGLSRLEG